jgi:hypothetical protein
LCFQGISMWEGGRCSKSCAGLFKAHARADSIYQRPPPPPPPPPR